MPIIIKRIPFVISDKDMRDGKLEPIIEDQINHFEKMIGPMVGLSLLEKADLADGISGQFIATFRDKRK